MVSTKAKLGRAENALFAYFTPGLPTTGMEWCHSGDRHELERKVRRHLSEIQAHGTDRPGPGGQARSKFDADRVVELLYRPFITRYLYHDASMHEVLDRSTTFFSDSGDALNTCILLVDRGADRPFTVCASNTMAHLRYAGPGSSVNMVALHRIGPGSRRTENLTAWGLERFRTHFGPRLVRSLAEGVDAKVPSTIAAVRAARAQGRRRPEVRPPVSVEIDPITVFHYVYAVLNDPIHPPMRGPGSLIAPPIPLYRDLESWSDLGRRLLELHTGFEMVEPWRLEVRTEHAGPARGAAVKASVVVDKTNGSIQLDRYTSVQDIPSEAWSYVLGDRTALEWVAEAWREAITARQDPAAKAGSRYIDQLERTIQRIKKVCRVSMETHRIRKELAMLTR